MPGNVWSHAVVVGGGMSGLMAAGALTEHFSRVTLVERDHFNHKPNHRPGTPQDRHYHGLLNGGLGVLNRLFPGLGDTLLASGAPSIKLGFDGVTERRNVVPLPKRDLGLQGIASSRILLELRVREALARNPRLTILDEHRVAAIRSDSFTASIEGQSLGKPFRLDADLVVDASGQGRLTLNAIGRAGLMLPRVSGVDLRMGYSTATFRAPHDHGPAGITTFPDPPLNRRGGTLKTLEGGRWIVTLVGFNEDWPPDNHEGFLAFARSLWTKSIYNAICNVDPEEPIRRFVFKASRRRHFEELSDFPPRILPIGDAISLLNPVHGQGMSVAALQVQVLDETLQLLKSNNKSPANLWKEYFSRCAEATAFSWNVSEGADSALVAPVNSTSAKASTLDFSSRIHRLAHEDEDVHRLLVEVGALLKPPSALMRPDIIARAMALT